MGEKMPVRNYLISLFLFVPIMLSACTQSSPLMCKKSEGVCQNLSTNMIWYIEKSNKFTSLEDAQKYVDQLEVENYKDWRLPTYNEWYTLLNIIDLKKQGDCSLALRGNYWLLDESGKGMSGFFDRYPLCGGSEFKFVNKKNGTVIAVRP
jgi:hypothetical protein